MGHIITKVKVKLDYAGGTDVNYNQLTVSFNGNKEDLINTVKKFLENQVELGLLQKADLRSIRVTDDTQDKDGVFGDLVADIKDLFN